MRTNIVLPERVQLSILHPDNSLLIENGPDSVVIRTVRGNVSAREKTSFVRYLAAEGYIPERYQWFPDSEEGSYSGLTWMVDASPVNNDLAARRKAVRQILRLILCAGLVWLAAMVLAFLHAGAKP